MITSENPPPQNPPPPIVTDLGILQKTLFDDFVQSVLANGEMIMPCIPALTDYYIWRIGALFQAIDSRFSQEQLQQVGQMIAKNIVEGFRISPHSKLRLKYEPSQPTNEGYKFKTSILAASIVEQLRLFLVKMCDVLCSGGLLLFAIFLCQDDYEPDPLTRHIYQLQLTSFFTPQDLASAMK